MHIYFKRLSGKQNQFVGFGGKWNNYILGWQGTSDSCPETRPHIWCHFGEKKKQNERKKIGSGQSLCL